MHIKTFLLNVHSLLHNSYTLSFKYWKTIIWININANTTIMYHLLTKILILFYFSFFIQVENYEWAPTHHFFFNYILCCILSCLTVCAHVPLLCFVFAWIYVQKRAYSYTRVDMDIAQMYLTWKGTQKQLLPRPYIAWTPYMNKQHT